MVLVSGFAVHLVLAPRPPLWFACFAALPARSARPPPPRGLPQYRAKTRRLAGVVFELVFGGY